MIILRIVRREVVGQYGLGRKAVAYFKIVMRGSARKCFGKMKLISQNCRNMSDCELSTSQMAVGYCLAQLNTLFFS
jgi:hypothetical protein